MSGNAVSMILCESAKCSSYERTLIQDLEKIQSVVVHNKSSEALLYKSMQRTPAMQHETSTLLPPLHSLYAHFDQAVFGF